MNGDPVLTAWARVLIASLRAAGLERVVISPGSRSTPLAWAALEDANVACDSIVDERSAAFYAVGEAKITGRPVAVLCTSGSAAANYYPAVVEASMSHTPLVVLTADRPYELDACGASQTIDQVKLYGGYVRRFFELGMPDSHPDALRALARKAAQGYAMACGPEPGPVHFNFRARKPLEPVTLEPALAPSPPRVAIAEPEAPREAIAELAERCGRAKRGIVVAGPILPARRIERDALEAFLRRSGFALFAEATSQLRFSAPEGARSVDALDLLLRSPGVRRAFDPDLILHLGASLTSTGFALFAREKDELERHVISDSAWADPFNGARSIVFGNTSRTLRALTEALGPEPPRPDEAFGAWLADANARAFTAVEEELGEPGTLSEGAAVSIAVDALGDPALLALSNSLPVRHVDTFCRARHRQIVVWCQRGASGIDGIVSGAAGAARAARRPATLLTGDLALLHDLGGLATAAKLEVPFVIVVLNNDGGRIFEQLPLYRAPGVDEDALAAWLTPHGLGFEHAARLFGCRYERADGARDLRRALKAAGLEPGCTLVEVTLDPHGAREQQARLIAKIERIAEHITPRAAP